MSYAIIRRDCFDSPDRETKVVARKKTYRAARLTVKKLEATRCGFLPLGAYYDIVVCARSSS